MREKAFAASLQTPSMREEYRYSTCKRITKRLAYRRNDKANLEIVEESPEEETTAPAVSSMNKDMAPLEQKVLQGPETLHSAVSSSAVDRIKRNMKYPSSAVMARGPTVRDGPLDEYNYPPKPTQKPVERHQSCTICTMPLSLLTLTDSVWEYATISLDWLKWKLF